MTRGLATGLLAVLLLAQGALQHRATGGPIPSARSAATSPAEIVPAGSIIPIELKSTVNSRTAYVEQAIYAETIFPVVSGGHIMIPVHSYVRGEVTEVVRPGRVSGKAKLGLRCDLLILPTGTTRSISARVISLAGTRIMSDTGKDQGDAAGGSDDSTLISPSAANQQSAIVDASGVLDPSVSGAAEGVGGLIVTLATRERTIILRPGTTLELQLTQPLDLKGPASGGSKVKP